MSAIAQNPREPISVQAASELLKKSPATVKRWCKEGKLEARKLGRQWLINPASVPGSGSLTATEHGDLATSLAHIKSTDLGEIWVPDCLDFADSLADETALLDQAQLRLEGKMSIRSAEDIAIPKTPYFARPGQLIDLPDRVAYHSMALPLMKPLEQALSDVEGVYSTRMSDDPIHLFADGLIQWKEWRRRCLEQSEENAFVVKTDITAFFENVSHDHLISSALAIHDHPNLAHSLREPLAQWARVAGRGIPQGPDISRGLSAVHLLPIDRRMKSRSWTYLRFMDDIRVFADSRGKALEAMQRLEEECRLRGLSLSGQKTELIEAASAAQEFVSEDLNRAQYVLRHDPISGRLLLHNLLADALIDESHPNTRNAKFALWRLQDEPDEDTYSLLLSNLETCSPIARVVLPFMLRHPAKDELRREISRFVVDPDRNTSVYLLCWLLGLMIDQNDTREARWGDYCLRVLESEPPTYLHGLAAHVVATHGSTQQVNTLKRMSFDEALGDNRVRNLASALCRGQGPSNEVLRLLRRRKGLEGTANFLAEHPPPSPLSRWNVGL